jgi:hypothetical protein
VTDAGYRVRITSKATQKVRQGGKEGKKGRSLGKMAEECTVPKSLLANLRPTWHKSLVQKLHLRDNKLIWW